MPRVEHRADRRSRIAGGGLHEHVLHRPDCSSADTSSALRPARRRGRDSRPLPAIRSTALFDGLLHARGDRCALQLGGIAVAVLQLRGARKTSTLNPPRSERVASKNERSMQPASCSRSEFRETVRASSSSPSAESHCTLCSSAAARSRAVPSRGRRDRRANPDSTSPDRCGSALPSACHREPQRKSPPRSSVSTVASSNGEG